MNSNRIAMVAYTEYVRDPRVRRYAECLVRKGYDVDCYVLKEKNKSAREELNGVKLIHLETEQYRGNSNIAYISSYLHFFIQIVINLCLEIKNNYIIIHVHNMPDFLVFSTFINKLCGSKIILDIHDNMPELYKVKFGILVGKIFYHFLLFQERLSCLYADKIVTVHVPHHDYNVKYHSLNPKKTFIIPNFADTNLFQKPDYISNKNKSTFNLIYHGTIAKRFGLKSILKGIKNISHDFPNIRLNIYGKGDGVKDLNQNIKSFKLQEIVTFHGQVDLDLIPIKIFESDLGIVSYIKSDSTELMLPLKLMEYTAMGLPSLTVKNTPIKYYFNDNELIYYSNNNENSFSKTLTKLLESPSILDKIKTKLIKVNKRLNWNNEQQKYITEIQKLTGNY